MLWSFDGRSGYLERPVGLLWRFGCTGLGWRGTLQGRRRRCTGRGARDSGLRRKCSLGGRTLRRRWAAEERLVESRRRTGRRSLGEGVHPRKGEGKLRG